MGESNLVSDRMMKEDQLSAHLATVAATGGKEKLEDEVLRLLNSDVTKDPANQRKLQGVLEDLQTNGRLAQNLEQRGTLQQGGNQLSLTPSGPSSGVEKMAARLAQAAVVGNMAEEVQNLLATETDPLSQSFLRKMQSDIAQQGPISQSINSAKEKNTTNLKMLSVAAFKQVEPLETSSLSMACSAEGDKSKIVEDCEDDLKEAMGLSRLADGHAKLFLRETVEEVDLDYVLVCTENWANRRLLGEGGYGKVFRATDTLGSKPLDFAAKRLECKNEEEREVLNKMTDAEIKTLTSFNHPNIIKLLGFCKAPNLTVLLYEYEPAGSVDRHLEDTELAKKLSWHSRAKIVKGLLAALHHLHTNDSSGPCYHGDVKPANIVLTASGDPKLIDCELARLATPARSGRAKTLFFRGTKGSVAPGTPGFKCPKYERTGIFNEKSEMYSVGVTVLQITTGLVDFADDRLDSLVESPEVSAIEEKRDERPPFDDMGDRLIVDCLAAMVETSVVLKPDKRCTLETLRRMAETLPSQRTHLDEIRSDKVFAEASTVFKLKVPSVCTVEATLEGLVMQVDEDGIAEVCERAVLATKKDYHATFDLLDSLHCLPPGHVMSPVVQITEEPGKPLDHNVCLVFPACPGADSIWCCRADQWEKMGNGAAAFSHGHAVMQLSHFSAYCAVAQAVEVSRQSRVVSAQVSSCRHKLKLFARYPRCGHCENSGVNRGRKWVCTCSETFDLPFGSDVFLVAPGPERVCKFSADPPSCKCEEFEFSEQVLEVRVRANGQVHVFEFPRAEIQDSISAAALSTGHIAKGLEPVEIGDDTSKDAKASPRKRRLFVNSATDVKQMHWWEKYLGGAEACIRMCLQSQPEKIRIVGIAPSEDNWITFQEFQELEKEIRKQYSSKCTPLFDTRSRNAKIALESIGWYRVPMEDLRKMLSDSTGPAIVASCSEQQHEDAEDLFCDVKALDGNAGRLYWSVKRKTDSYLEVGPFFGLMYKIQDSLSAFRYGRN